FNRKRYASFVIDVYTKYTWIMFTRRKSEVPRKVTELLSKLEAQYSIQIVQVQSDRGELYRGHFPEWAARHAPNPIVQIRSPADVHDFNGIVERPQGLVRVKAAAMLVHSKLPKHFYIYALEYACTVWNATVHTNQSVTPYELVHGRRDNVLR